MRAECPAVRLRGRRRVRRDLGGRVVLRADLPPHLEQGPPRAPAESSACAARRLYKTPSNGALLCKTPFNGAPLNKTPFDGAPLNKTPFNGAPLYKTPFNGAPLYKTPFNGAPLYKWRLKKA